MAKQKSFYQCTECGHKSAKSLGKCPGCGSWNTLVEALDTSSAVSSRSGWSGSSTEVMLIDEVANTSYERDSTGLSEFDRVLGGGLVKGSVILIGGDPGIGKSTLLIQTMAHLSKDSEVLYVSGEESTSQIAQRAKRLGLTCPRVKLANEVVAEKIVNSAQQNNSKFLVIDSIQTLYTEQLESSPGSVSQVRECAAALTKFAKKNEITLVFIGHVTKEGSIAGPHVLEHIVDAVLSFESDGSSPFRMLRSSKNRYGPVNELGVFNMTGTGLEPVTNPSEIFITEHEKPVQGSAILSAMEGNRPFLVEVQALVEDTASPNPKRYASGVDTSRLQMLLAVLNKFAGVVSFDQNVYVKIVGGLRLTEPAADLAVLLAVYSSLRSRPLPSGLVVCGEVGLTGEVRNIAQIETRIKEAARLGFKTIIVPHASVSKIRIDEKIEIIPVKRLDDAFSALKSILDKS